MQAVEEECAMFGTQEDVEEALKRNEGLAKDLEKDGFKLINPDQESIPVLDGDYGCTVEYQPRTDDNDADFWRSLYHKQKAITTALEQKIEELYRG